MCPYNLYPFGPQKLSAKHLRTMNRKSGWTSQDKYETRTPTRDPCPGPLIRPDGSTRVETTPGVPPTVLGPKRSDRHLPPSLYSSGRLLPTGSETRVGFMGSPCGGSSVPTPLKGPVGGLSTTRESTGPTDSTVLGSEGFGLKSRVPTGLSVRPPYVRVREIGW